MFVFGGVENSQTYPGTFPPYTDYGGVKEKRNISLSIYRDFVGPRVPNYVHNVDPNPHSLELTMERTSEGK